MSYVEFESSKEKEALRNGIREARQRILDKAEEDFVKKAKRERERREKEKWLLPSVSDRISGSKPKKDKKKKKEKKKKRRKNDDNDDGDIGQSARCESSSSSAAEEDQEVDEWVEKDSAKLKQKATTKDEKLERDSWMMFPSCLVPTASRDELGQRTKGCVGPTRVTEEEKQRRQLLEKPGQHERELNPFWKDGGTGLPSDEKKVADGSQRNPKIGDGGYEWLERAYRRAKEQATDEDRSLEDVVSERWGSLANLENLIDEAAKKRNLEQRSRNDRDRSSSRRFHRPSEDRRRNESDHFRFGSSSRSRHELSPSSSYPNKKSSFLAPRDQDDDEAKQPSSEIRATSSIAPRWKKKEFIEERKENPMTRIQEKDVKVDARKTEKVVDVPKRRSPSPQQPPPPPQETPLTEKEMNDLGAKIIKAELIGNNELASKLKAKLEEAKELKKRLPTVENKKEEEIVIVKRKTFRDDRSEPSGARLSKKRVETHDRHGQRERYFADDDKYSLKQMFEREKMGTAEDQNAMFSRLASHGVQKTTDDFDMDDMLESRANRHVSDEKIDDQLRQRTLRDHQRSSSAVDKCRLCFDGKDTPKHLMVAIGIKAYLSLPSHKSLTDGHCLIVPMQHVENGTHLDEDVWSEVQIFRKGLTRMFEEQERDVVFFETSMNLRWYPHMVLHCIPLPKDVGNLAPMYFKKAIMESETEWSNNKKLVDLSQKDVRRAVPKGLPYFSVDFGLQGGFAHVIEDEKLFPNNFAQEIIGGMLDLDQSLWRKPQRENFEEQRKKVLQFAEWWKPYDWTQRLKE